MTILLYDYRELEERASRQLSVWKTWHLLIYASAGIFGIVNYVFLQNTMAMVDNRCVLYPRVLEFRTINISDTHTRYSSRTKSPVNSAQHEEDGVNVDHTSFTQKQRREINSNNDTTLKEPAALPENDISAVSGGDNENERIVLDTARTLFAREADCQFAEYMPIMSMILAASWATMFVMCPSGGYSRSGLQQPWRILMPALLFALVMVGLTGHSFFRTNDGLQMFCSAFHNVTNATTCSSAGEHLESSREVSWSFGGRVSATRAASAGVWASWACAAALLLARCLTAPDFRVRRTGVYLKDPHQKIIPHLKTFKSQVRQRGVQSPARADEGSVRSEPTVTTELVMASIEQDHTAPLSVDVSPIKKIFEERIEMTTTPNSIH